MSQMPGSRIEGMTVTKWTQELASSHVITQGQPTVQQTWKFPSPVTGGEAFVYLVWDWRHEGNILPLASSKQNRTNWGYFYVKHQ